MKNKIIEFYNNFNIDDIQSFISELDLLTLLSHPAVVSTCILLGLLSIYKKWRLIIVSVLAYSFLYGYLFVTFVVIKNSELSSVPTFIMFLGAILLISGLGIYKKFIRG